MDPELKALPVGEAELLRDGTDAAILAYGIVVHPALEAAGELAAEGVSCAVLNARFAKPLDETRILALARKVRVLVTAEEHAGMGGFGSAVLELLAREGITVPVRTLALADRLHEHGSPAKQRSAARLDVPGIASAVRGLLGR
jgi:1-deoxy-D-xylulose-5-phosphate synthase